MMRYLTVAVLVVLFALGSAFSWLACILFPRRASEIFHAQNRLCGAAWLGFDGKKTISATCGERLRENPSCQPCKAICKALHEALEEGHCEKEAT